MFTSLKINLGTHHYIDLRHFPLDLLPSQLDFYRDQYSFQVIAIENNISYPSTPIYTYQFQPNSIVIFGEEGQGIPDYILDLADTIVEIPMTGAVRSINVGTASGIVMFEYERQRHG